MTEIQGKSILVRVSARFELVRVRVIGSRLYSVHQSAPLTGDPDGFYVISMEFLSLSRRRYSSRNVLSGKERGETNVFAGYFLFHPFFGLFPYCGAGLRLKVKLEKFLVLIILIETNQRTSFQSSNLTQCLINVGNH